MLPTLVNQKKREATIKGNLFEHLKQILQSLLYGDEGVLHLSNSAPKGPVLGHSENTNSLCNALEAIFIHGLKNRISEKFVKIFSSNPDRMPVPNFWPVVLTISHRDLMEQVSSLNFINSDVGKSRSWLRISLNQGQLISYINILVGDQMVLKDYYKPFALLRDSEICDLMLRVLQPLSNISFSLATNAAALNTWTQTPLVLAGIWAPQNYEMHLTEPVLTATDIASTIEEPKQQSGIDIPTCDLNDEMFKIIIQGTPDMHLDISSPEPSESGLEEPPDIPLEGKSEDQDTTIEENEAVNSCVQSPSMLRSVSTIVDDNDYGTLFADLNESGSVDTLPSFLAQYQPNPPASPDSLLTLEKIREEETEYEVIANEIPAGSRSDLLLPLLCTLTNEEGLDSQNFNCYNEKCANHIGISYGRPRLCKYENKYYCDDCHVGDVSVIPSRILHNWDFRQHPVCINCKAWLDSVAMLPLINLRTVNSKLYRCFEELAEVQLLRIELYYIQAYLFTCRFENGKTFKQMFWPREHLYEHVNTFAILDLHQIYNGKLLPLLRSAVEEGKRHILSCSLCSPRGFICEVCRTTEIIYPFQMAETHTCPDCCGVFHKTCMATLVGCPKCERKKKKQESLES